MHAAYTPYLLAGLAPPRATEATLWPNILAPADWLPSPMGERVCEN